MLKEWFLCHNIFCCQQAEKDLAPYYQRYVPPYPYTNDGSEVSSMGVLGSRPKVSAPRGNAEDERLRAQREAMENESVKLWLRMRREAIRQLRAQGFVEE